MRGLLYEEIIFQSKFIVLQFCAGCWSISLNKTFNVYKLMERGEHICICLWMKNIKVDYKIYTNQHIHRNTHTQTHTDMHTNKYTHTQTHTYFWLYLIFISYGWIWYLKKDAQLQFLYSILIFWIHLEYTSVYRLLTPSYRFKMVRILFMITGEIYGSGNPMHWNWMEFQYKFGYIKILLE